MRRLLASYLLLFLSFGSAQNILNNPGFEYGLMCYGNNIWSVTDIFGKGDYRLRLSPDAHSGNYSLEIECPGPDCFKAAAYSDRIPTIGGQTYTLSLYAKCPPGATATVHVPNTTTGDLTTFMNCNGDWTLNTFSFQMAPGAKDFFYYLFSYWGQWARFDDVVLTYGDGSAPAPSILHAGVRNVSVSDQALMVDGAPYLALGFFDAYYADLAEIAALGANTAFGLGGQPHAACFNTTQIGYQDRAYELGLNFVPDSGTSVRLGVPSIFPDIMTKFAPHLANIAWMLADEPDQTFIPFWYVDPSIFVASANAAKTKTTLPILADFQRAAWSVVTDVAPYIPGVDFYMAEPYGPEFQYVTHAATMFKTMPARPIWLAQDDQDAPLIVPKTYWGLVNGATGFAYFTWNAFKSDPAKLAAAQQVFSEFNQLKSVIFSQNITPFVTAPAGIGYMARYKDGAAYILAVHPIEQNTSSTFLLNGLTAGQQIEVLFENRTIIAAAGRFTDSFAGKSRHVYKVTTPISAIAGRLISKSGSDAARTWRIEASNTGLAALTGAAISSATFTNTGGKACSPVVLSPLPLSVGAINPAATATADLLIDFTGCDTTSKFTVNIRLRADGGAAASIVRNNERK